MLFKIRARGRGLASKFRSRGGVCRMERHGDESHGNAGCNNGKHLGIIYMYTLEFLHVHPVLPTCTSSSTYMYIQFFLHVHAVRPTCTSGFVYMYMPFDLHVHPVFPTCTCRSNYMYIQFFLHVHAVRTTCTSGFSYMYVPTPGYCARRWLRVYALIERVYLKGACWQ